MFALLIGNPERDHALEDAMAHRLSPGAPPVRFDFQVQLHRVGATPIEGPAERMEGARLPFPHGCHDRDPRPGVHLTASRNAAEALTFTPEHALPEHEPQGSINRVRVAVCVRRRRREPRSRDEWLSSAAARVPP